MLVVGYTTALNASMKRLGRIRLTAYSEREHMSDAPRTRFAIDFQGQGLAVIGENESLAIIDTTTRYITFIVHRDERSGSRNVCSSFPSLGICIVMDGTVKKWQMKQTQTLDEKIKTLFSFSQILVLLLVVNNKTNTNQKIH